MKSACFCLLGLTLALYTPAFAQPAPSTPAEMISTYRLQQGEGRVISDRKLFKIAQEQASAMASKQMLDHSVLAPFNLRVASLGSDRAAESIAYGYDNFAKTLDLWIGSNGHRYYCTTHLGSALRAQKAPRAAPIGQW
jgi:uncharacterized protein YkwD